MVTNSVTAYVTIGNTPRWRGLVGYILADDRGLAGARGAPASTLLIPLYVNPGRLLGRSRSHQLIVVEHIVEHSTFSDYTSNLTVLMAL